MSVLVEKCGGNISFYVKEHFVQKITNISFCGLYKFLLSLLMMALCVGFASCGEDNDNNPNNNGGDDGNGVDNGGGTVTASIVGTWQSTWRKGYEIVDGVRREWDESDTEEHAVFYSDGTGEWGDGGYEDFTWRLSGNKLTMYYIYDDEADICTVKTLTATKMVLVINESDEEGVYHDEVTFKRVNGNTPGIGDDDDNPGIGDTDKALVGTWNAVWISGYAYYDGIKKTFDEAYTYDDGFIFNSDGTGFYIDEEEYESMRWNTYNGKLLISVGDETEVATIKSVSGNTLILVDQGEDEDGPYYYETTYKKR